jgi:hypothetical protein
MMETDHDSLMQEINRFDRVCIVIIGMRRGRVHTCRLLTEDAEERVIRVGSDQRAEIRGRRQ